jgi:protein TonB
MPQEKSAHAVCLFSFASSLSTESTGINAAQTMRGFTQPLIVDANDRIERRAANCFASLAAHGAVIAALLMLPLFSSSAPHSVPWMRDMVVIPLPPMKKTVIRHNQGSGRQNVLSSVPLMAPNFSARTISLDMVEPPAELNAIQSDAMSSATDNGNVLGGIVGVSAAALVAPVMPQSQRIVHLGGDVTNSHPLDKLNLVYPQLAKAAHIVGRVVIQAIIDETGKVVNARAISGPPLLYIAAVEAVSKERFAPVLLNGEPTRCDLQVQVSFHLSQF